MQTLVGSNRNPVCQWVAFITQFIWDIESNLVLPSLIPPVTVKHIITNRKSSVRISTLPIHNLWLDSNKIHINVQRCRIQSSDDNCKAIKITNEKKRHYDCKFFLLDFSSYCVLFTRPQYPLLWITDASAELKSALLYFHRQELQLALVFNIIC